MLKRILIVFAVLVGIVLVLAGVATAVVLMQPADYRVERSVQIQASPDVVFARISDFDSWKTWQPWQGEPSLTITNEGTPGRSGHKSTFVIEGTYEGWVEIAESRPPNHVVLKVVLAEPAGEEATVVFDVAEAGDGTTVTASLEGSRTSFGKLLSLIVNDEMLGVKCEEGLGKLKNIIEAEVKGKVIDEVPDDTGAGE